MKEKFEAEIRDLEKIQQEYKSKQDMMRSEMMVQDATIKKMNITLSDLQSERIQLQKVRLLLIYQHEHI